MSTDATNELKTSVSEGKSLIAAAVTDKGVNTAADATFQTIANNIRSIVSTSDYTLVRSTTYFVLYNNYIRSAKIVINFPSTKIKWNKSGTSIGTISPCNPSSDILLLKYYEYPYDTSFGYEKIVVSKDGNLYCYGTVDNKEGYSYSNYDRSKCNGTYYWSY